MRTPFIVHITDVAEEEGSYPAPFDQEKLSLGRNLGKAAGSVNVGMWHERIPPGRRTSFTHAHSHEEELIYVLEGTCALLISQPGKEPVEVAVRAGHTISFPAGTGIAHSAINRGTEDCMLLCFGERKPGIDRCLYTDGEYQQWALANRPDRTWSGP
ncbi:MAG: cupin domain-containing protein [Myxococcaceae bacterium]|nr:cupin domain-containing protein [Myxococcaceae bacterium]